jgi:mono/diheme cytochrome c family protein
MAGLGRAGGIRQGLVLAVILAVTPAFAADPDNGERLARRWCAACHVAASNQRGPTAEAPPFAENSGEAGLRYR